MHPRTVVLSTALLLALGVAGCVPAPTPVAGANPYPPPPPVRAEVIPKPPVSEAPLIWEPGHWDWAGSGYSWQEGQWIQRAGHGTEWQDGYWSNQNPSGTWTWIAAHWI